ncbi:MAG: ferritin-like domain-containing protein [Polyangiaceae bacterium]|nr:ferritin-like domain-containing protein [Polyangiaceae bacterium]
MHSLDVASARRRILLAMGLVPAIASAACGGMVVFVEEDGGEGGAGTTASTTTGTTASTTKATTGPGCENPTFPTVCVVEPPGGCPDFGAPNANELVTEHINKTCVTDTPEFCSCYTEDVSLKCGPSSEHEGDCCYVASYTVQEICEGRPFVVNGASLLAPTERRSDWLEGVAAGGHDLEESVRVALADAWTERARYEHASIASFARVTLELLSLGAPRELIDAAQRAAADETMHAALCFAIASSLSGQDIGPGPLDVGSALVRSDARAIVEATVREGCLGETVSAIIALAARDAAIDPGARAALDRIATDELAHAELAWRTVTWAIKAGLPGALDAATAAFTEPFFLENEGDLPACVPPEVARAYGILPAGDRAQAIRRALEEVVAPSRNALLAATTRRESPKNVGYEA